MAHKAKTHSDSGVFMPTAHLMNSSPTRSINIFKTETNQGPVHWTLCPLTLVDFNKNIIL